MSESEAPTTAAATAAATASLPRGFRPAADPPKVGRRVLALLADGTPEFVTFDKLPSTEPAVMFSYGYSARGQNVVVKAWRPIPSNWS
jgi:hypothetical protein